MIIEGKINLIYINFSIKNTNSNEESIVANNVKFNSYLNED